MSEKILPSFEIHKVSNTTLHFVTKYWRIKKEKEPELIGLKGSDAPSSVVRKIILDTAPEIIENFDRFTLDDDWKIYEIKPDIMNPKEGLI